MKQHLVRLNNPIAIISILVAIVTYYICTDFISPSRNVLRHVKQYLLPQEVTFFSGNEKGTYHRIAMVSEIATGNGPISVRNVLSEGATENLLRVASSRRAISLIQEDTIASSLLDPDFVKRDIRIVAPIYTEKLHILYWPIDTVLGNEQPVAQKALTLRERSKPVDTSRFSSDDSRGKDLMTSEARQDASVYLSHSSVRMSLGRPNGGTLLLSHALLERCGVAGFESREENLLFDEALERFTEKEIHAVFFMTGAPLDSVRKMLDRGAKLMAIRGVNLMRQLHDDFGFVLRPSQFSDSYGAENNVATLGTRAVLISSDDLTQTELLTVLRSVQHSLEETESNPSQALAQLDGRQILPFKSDSLEDSISVVASLSEREGDQRTKDILVFLVSVAGTFLAAKTAVVRFVSSLKRKLHFSKFVDIEGEIIAELRGRPSKASCKRAESNLDSLHSAWSDVLTDYQTGGLSDEAVGFLREEFDSAIDRCSTKVSAARSALSD